jgi:biotin carboxyl carrier protein
MTEKSIYQAVVNETSSLAVTQTLLDQAIFTCDASGQPTTVILSGQRFEVLCLRRLDTRRFLIKVEGISFEVELKRPVQQVVEALGFNKVISHSHKSIFSPMPGQVLQVDIEPGQVVKKGEDLLTLEAMKMENTIQAPLDGIIKEIFVRPGDTVKKSQQLVELE